MDLDAILSFIYICLPSVFAFLCLYYAFDFLKSARAIEDTPTSKVRSAAQGYVELSGTASALLNPPLCGKLSQKPCAWYRYTIEYFTSRRSENHSARAWELVEQGVSPDPLVLTDDTGNCVIVWQGAEVLPIQSLSWRGHTRIAAPLPTSFWKWVLWDSWGAYRYTEYRLELGSPLQASGMFYTLKSTDPYIQSNPLLQEYCQNNSLSNIAVLLKKDLSQNQNFLISALPQKRLTRRLKIKALVFFIAFLFFAGVSVYSYYPVIKRALTQIPAPAPIH